MGYPTNVRHFHFSPLDYNGSFQNNFSYGELPLMHVHLNRKYIMLCYGMLC